MLKLQHITKNYVMGDTSIHALRDVSIEFRENEFVSILGPSGCGKTTLLNIIGGLDKYTSGDLVINGKSTKQYTDRDWDTYRNHSIGFVFQSYNLIPHQTVLSNVELALTLSGVSPEERKKRAISVLEKVGLGDQLYKKPNQMSGGQMQRVAIARALVNDPDILLADEPTRALDSETSVQIMDILKEISKEKLIIMVTHNPELAEAYSNRIIRLLDGSVTDDSNPYKSEPEVEEKKKKPVKKKRSMSFFTALLLSLNNLMTKKGRTFLTSFAGSIGIIGIALILSVSSGVNAYINSVEKNTMSSYPIEIYENTMDTMSLLSSLMEQNTVADPKPNTIYSNDVMVNVMDAFSKGITSNNLTAFKAYIEKTSAFADNSIDIKYRYRAGLNTYTVIKDVDAEGNVRYSYKKNLGGINELMTELGLGESTEGAGSLISSAWSELVGDIDHIKSQYNIVENGGRFPENDNEVVLIVGEDLLISDFTLYTLGIRDVQELKNYLRSIYDADPSNDITIDPTSYTFDEILNYEFKVIPDSMKYKLENGRVVRRTEYEINNILSSNACETVKVVGIVTPSEDSLSSGAVGSIGYLNGLMDKMIAASNTGDAISAQMSNTTTNLLTGFPFAGFTYDVSSIKNMLFAFSPELANYIKSDDQVVELIKSSLGEGIDALLIDVPYGGYLGTDPEHMAKITGVLTELSEINDTTVSSVAKLLLMQSYTNPQNLANIVNAMVESSDYDGVLSDIGYVSKDKPSSILIYPKDFDAKDIISQEIDNYNKSMTSEEDRITYTDTVGLLMSSVTTIVNAISYVLIAFVAISLVVSSIMIGIITYISVLERTKEIGILRAIGASKKDVSRVFNAETLIVGFAAGAIGIAVTLVLNIFINIILFSLTGLEALKATLPPVGAVILVLISMGLTLIAGLIPSRVAAKKDPVIALRTE